MAKQGMQNTSSVFSQGFSKGLVKDIEDSLSEGSVWSHARNAINNSKSGDLGTLGNEQGNYLCASAPYTVIGAIHLYNDTWAIFSTNDTDSEIGIFDEGQCSYTTKVNDPCLNFNKLNLITGVAREKEDCTWQVYWSDARRNPDRTMNLDNIPWVQSCTTVNGCTTCENTTDLDCDAIRLARLVTAPCIRVEKGASGGTLRNGSYYALIAYTIKNIRVTDYFMPSNIQSIFDHDNVAGSIDVIIDSIDTDNFDEFELVIVQTVNQQTVAKKMGIYSVRQKSVSFDQIKESLPSIPIEFIPLRTPLYESSDAMYEVSNYLLRVGPTTKFDFNYQPLANQITTKWAAVQYPGNYYQKMGNNTGYLRDEVYSFFIRWVYNTGDKSASYHIPGRASTAFDVATVAGTDAQIEINEGITPFRWRVENTASVTALPGTVLPDGGILTAEGLMGYWESTELYPDDKPQIWNSSSQTWSGTASPDYDLCGLPIRHHRFPDNFIGGINPVTNHVTNSGNTIQIMGVKFENIKPPRDNNGDPVPGIVGYEILRGSREGNKSVVAKGIINNMGEYTIDGGTTARTGMYPNYPYNDLNPDPFLSTTETSTGALSGLVQGLTPYNSFSRDTFSFHSPDTQFKNPFLSAKEIKIYGELRGIVEGQFVEPDKHPKHKHATNLTFFVSIVAGIAGALFALTGKRKTQRLYPRKIDLGGYPNILAGATAGTVNIPLPGFGPAAEAAIAAANTNIGVQDGLFYDTGAQVGITAAGGDTGAYQGAINTGYVAPANLPATLGYSIVHEEDQGVYDTAPLIIRTLNALPTFGYYMSEGAETMLRLIMAFSPYRQHVLQYQSHGFYNSIVAPQANNNRREINESIYLTPNIHDFSTTKRINNLFRGKSVAVELLPGSIFADPLGADNTRQRVSDNPWGAGNPFDNPTLPFNTSTACHYAALKQRIRNQYGQLDGIQQVPVSTCVYYMTTGELANYAIPGAPIPLSNSQVFFNGDTYVSRYTEKNSFMYFYDWLYDQPDGYEFNYLLRKMLPFPSYWMDTTKYDINEFFSSVAANPLVPASWVLPTDRRAFDRDLTSINVFMIKRAFMYLASSGVRDFFVESEINTDTRDWGDTLTERHYDPYRFTDIGNLFNAKPEILKSGNFFKYDISLSASRLFNNFISWGNVQPRFYDPLVAQSCYSYYPDRVIYSLPQQTELRKDNWFMFLANNYKDFKARVTAIKPIGKNGAIILFDTESPVMFQGVDTLETTIDTKITLGDGGLFTQPLQNTFNADAPYEYGSCQSRNSIINTPAGLFWISQNQGKIFQMAGAPSEISDSGIKYWLAEYLPYKILQDFPNFELTDNTVIGVGCQSIYDNEYGLAYFMKRDFKLRDNLPYTVTYLGDDNFSVGGILNIKLGDPTYFEDASWTVSYDPKAKMWLSFHDWHPNLVIPSKTHFMSVLDNGIWTHNDRCDLYCNYYGVDYPFEIEYVAPTGQTVNVTRSLEYILECYRYSTRNCIDRFHVLDFNFDEAVLYNTEQVSGLLRLNLKPKNNVAGILQYPIINPTSIDILYSKEEQKYRFNQFWDITDDRGEFNPAAQRLMWITNVNGYTRVLNPNNLNYNKPPFQRKKFRHYINTVVLRRRVSGNTKMLLKIANNKNVVSSR
jgi:hypothetical protein